MTCKLWYYWLSCKWKRVSVDAPPASCPPCHYFCPKDLLTLIIASMTSRWRHMTSCDVMWRHVTSQQCDMTYYVITKWTVHSFSPFICLENHVFWPGDLDLWPMTLSIKLVRDIVEIHPSTNFRVRMSNGSAVRVFTDRRTDGRDRKHYLDRWCGRK